VYFLQFYFSYSYLQNNKHNSATTWLQLDISPCSYQLSWFPRLQLDISSCSYQMVWLITVIFLRYNLISVLVLTMQLVLYTDPTMLAAPLFTAYDYFCLGYHTFFVNTKKHPKIATWTAHCYMQKTLHCSTSVATHESEYYTLLKVLT